MRKVKKVTGSASMLDPVIPMPRIRASIPTAIVLFGGIALTAEYNTRRAKLYDIADSLDLPLIDLTAKIGDFATADAAGLMGDAVHENSRGYAIEAAAIARAISLY